jgi:hypothetical protein
MHGQGEYWDAQEKLFNVYVKRFGFNQRRVGTDHHESPNTFRRPSPQRSLFE